MNIELQVKMLYKNASQLDEAGFIVDFYYIAKEYARQQNGTKPDVMCQSTPLLHHYDTWCKETKRNGGVLVGSSIRELIEYLEAKTNEEIQKALIAS